MRIPDPKANTTTEAYLAYKAGYLEESELKPKLYKPDWHFDGWLAYWAGLTNEYPTKENGDPEMLCDEEALVAYLSGVTDTYPEEIKDPYDVRIVGYLRHLASIRWPEPDYPVNNEEFYLSTMEPTHTSNPVPSSDIELDTAEGKIISVEAYGDTYQQTYMGKNQFNIQTLAQGSITVTDGVASGSMAQFYTEFQNGITLTTTAPAMSITATAYHDGEPSSGNGFIFRAVYTDETAENIVVFPNSSTTATTLTGTTDSSKTLSKIEIVYGSGSSNLWHISNIQIEAGSTATTYEPYVGGVPAPNPDYPQNVNVVTGEQTVTVSGKNLLGYDYASLKEANPTTAARTWDDTTKTMTFYGITYKVNDDGSITVNGTASGGASFFYLTESLSLKVGNEYILNGCPEGGSLSSYSLRLYDGNSYKSDFGSGLDFTYGTQSGIRINISNGTSVNNMVIKPMVRIASDSDPTYEPYVGQTYTLDFGSVELCKIGDYQDYIYKSGDDWYMHQAISKVVLTGGEDETWSGGNNNIYFFHTVSGAYQPESRGTVASILCNYYEANSYNRVASTTTDYGVALDSNNAGRMAIRNKECANSTDLKTWLASNNTTVYYPLATPTDTKITDSTLIGQLDALAGADTSNEKTYIKVTATDPNLPALLKVEAYKY